MTKQLSRAMVLSILPMILSGCAVTNLAEPDWEALHANPPIYPAVATLVDRGFASCKNMLGDVTLHAVGDLPHQSIWSHSAESIDLRPATVTLVSRNGSDIEHAEVIAGLDGTGRCFARWSVSRVWRLSCDELHRKSPWLSKYSKQRELSEITSQYSLAGSGISVLLTSSGRRHCFMTASETAYKDPPGTDLDLQNH